VTVQTAEVREQWCELEVTSVAESRWRIKTRADWQRSHLSSPYRTSNAQHSRTQSSKRERAIYWDCINWLCIVDKGTHRTWYRSMGSVFCQKFTRSLPVPVKHIGS